MRWAILGGAIFVAVGQSQAALDLNGNLQSDLWEVRYAATNLPAGSDSDGDGVSNLAESIAGTDPYDALSFPAITLSSQTTGTQSAAWGAQAGKTYFLEMADHLGAPWTAITNVPGSNATQLAALDLSSFTQRLFRVRVEDVFSDGSGLTDWEKLQAGLARSNAWSNGRYDAQGHALDDLAYVTNQLAAQNVLTIVASDLTTVQPDVGSPAQDPGSLTILRGGFPFRSVTGTLAVSGTALEGIDYQTLPHTVAFPPGVISTTFLVTPMANTNRNTSATATLSLQPGAGYAVGLPGAASVIIQPSPTPRGTGLTGEYYDSTNTATFSSGAASFTASVLRITRTDPAINFTWSPTNLPDPSFLSNITYLVRWTGQVQPQYSEPYYFNTYMDDGVRVWVDGKLVLDRWVNQGVSDRASAPIDLQAGVRYDLRVEYYQATGSSVAQLSWYSASQAKQIIPRERLYPATVPAAAPALVSAGSAIALLGYPFTNQVAANNGAVLVSVGPLPPGLSFSATNRLISGVPTQAGRFQIGLFATNAAGPVQSVLDLTVIDTGAVISREVWTNAPGPAITNIPLDAAPDLAGQLAALEGPENFGDDYAQRWRGYLTAPLTGNYYFWIAANSAAELWIADDDEPVTKVRRCWVAPPGTGPRDWTNQPTQKSPWLALVAGQRYFLEVLHKAGAGTNDHVAVGWVRPDQTNALPLEVVPGQVLSPFIPAVANASSGTLFSTTMLAQGAAVSAGIGTATLVLSPDETAAVLKYSYTNLSSPFTSAHIHCDPFLTHPSQIIFDIDDATPEPDGSYRWAIEAIGTLSASELLQVLREGKAYINVHTESYPAGEIRGNFTLAVGSTTFVPPPEPPAWTDDHSSSNAAARFLIQATFGPSPAEIEAVRTLGYAGWLDDQFARPATHLLPYVLANASATLATAYPGTLTFNGWWKQSVTAPDQLRQRVAFALSQILVISDDGPLNNNARAEASYYDGLLDNAFGNVRELLERVTLSPAMGRYLDMLGNDKGSLTAGTHPNENYAREILQLFSIGLYRLWPDGTLVMNSKGTIVPTYDQREILGFAAVFTGWNYHQTNLAGGRLPTQWNPGSNWTNDMKLVPTHHDLGAKRILDNVVLPPATGLQASSTNVEYDSYGLQELELAHDAIFQHPNLGPFLCRQLIQRLVTSHPSREYVYRVVRAFNDNGAGVRGDLTAVIRAILLDYEARSDIPVGQPSFGKQREPLLRVTAVARAFPAPPPLAGTYSQAGTPILSLAFTNGHRLATGARARLVFTSGTPTPTDARYDVSVTGSNTLLVLAQGLATGTYGQAGSVLTITNAGHGVTAGHGLHLTFLTGGAASGTYQVDTVPSSSVFTVTAGDSATRSGACVFPKLTGGYQVSYEGTASNRIKVVTTPDHDLAVADSVQLDFIDGTATDGVYVVAQVADEHTFYVQTGGQANQTQSQLLAFPLVAPPLTRSGAVSLEYSTWLMSATDTDLAQTPLNSPTVFNFYFPDYKFAGSLAATGLTTPEFQLTSDSSVARLNNFLADGLLNGQGTNTSGLCSFKGGGEAITLDLGPWCSASFASSNGLPVLVDALNTLLMAGQLRPEAAATIATYAASTNLPYTTPSALQIRDRVRAVVHQLVVSPDFAIQR